MSTYLPTGKTIKMLSVFESPKCTTTGATTLSQAALCKATFSTVDGSANFMVNVIQHNESQHYDIQHNESQHYDIQHNENQHYDIQHNENQHYDIQHNEIQH
jgi:hypothetical protein